MKPRIYLAAMYSLKADIAARKAELENLCYNVTSTWTDEPQDAGVSLKDVDAELLAEYATRDVQEIDDADLLVLFTVDPDQLTRRGGRHVEFGYALAKGKQCVIVGPRENIFHHLETVVRMSSWTQFVDELISSEFDVPVSQ
jgi:nucleoside 2-deoxyribosyltransferase